MIGAKVNDPYIVYQTDNDELVKEQSSGKIVKLEDEKSGKQNSKSKQLFSLMQCF